MKRARTSSRSTPASSPTLAALAQEAHAGWPRRGGGVRAVRARAQLARALWSASGARRLPSARELDEALTAIGARDLAWVCELSPLAPLYLLPTHRFAHALARTVRELGVRRIVEVAAGDGFLSRALRRVAPDLDVVATDSGAWQRPSARMSAHEQRALRGVAVPGLALGSEVRRLAASTAVRTLAPELVLCAWLPPSSLLDTLVRADVRYVLEIGAGSGVTASAYAWRFAHDFLEGPLAQAARCRLDDDPKHTLHSRVTLYYGRRHPEHFEEDVRPGDWLWQFRPVRKRTSPLA